MNAPTITRSLAITIVIALLGLATGKCPAQPVWINEFHYDNTGTDVGEFVEIVAPLSLTDLTSVRLTLYNGGDGTPYGSSHLLSTFTPGATTGDFRVYSKSLNGLQNGAPDGFSLDVGGSLVQFVSYEGTFPGQTGPASGRTSADVHFIENETTGIGSSIGLTGRGGDYSDFAWTASVSATPGAVNAGQAIVPEPSTYAFFAGAGLGLFAYFRRRYGAGTPAVNSAPIAPGAEAEPGAVR